MLTDKYTRFFYMLLLTKYIMACSYTISHDHEACMEIDDKRFAECSSTNDNIYNSTKDWKSGDSVCGVTITTIEINIYPHAQLIKEYMEAISKTCCGPCVTMETVSRYESPRNLTIQMNRENFTLSADVTFPVLGRINSELILGQAFVSFIPIETIVFITLKKTKVEIMKDLIAACTNLWPLLTICLLLAFIAGFIGWLLDTWKNKDEFPRPFLSGVYEGFWWSFVSMTTVGYGDKTPLSVLARMFSVAWILIGITICSMFTASLTAAIDEATTTETPSMNGMKIGILDNRLLDASFVVSNGGQPYVYNSFDGLKAAVEKKSINGMLLDMLTMQYLLENTDEMTKFHMAQNDFSQEQMSYGALFKNYELANVFSKFMKRNSLMLETCINERKNKENYGTSEIDLFDTSSGFFWPFFVGSTTVIVAVMMVGAMCECFHRKSTARCEESRDTIEKKTEDDLIRTANLLFNKLASEKQCSKLDGSDERKVSTV